MSEDQILATLDAIEVLRTALKRIADESKDRISAPRIQSSRRQTILWRSLPMERRP